jgi:ABC-type dipeptide/oligopeptide/nickel transport system permease component
VAVTDYLKKEVTPVIVLILERVPATLRSELSRWLIEPRVGVFVSGVSAMVRDRLWEKAVRGSRGNDARYGGLERTYPGPPPF